MESSTISVFNPATEELLRTLTEHSVAEAQKAVERAKESQRKWAALSQTVQRNAMLAIADAIMQHRQELAELESQDVGKPISAALAETESVAEVFRYYAGAIDKLTGETIPVDGGVTMTFHEPIGVVGVITPWNFPLPIASWNIAPALAAGNSVVLKPASLTPLSSLRLGEIVASVSPVENLLQVVVGGGSTVGNAIIEHPDVQKISFTGSTEVGRSILAKSAQDIKRVTLELGGKSANIIFNDADLEKAAKMAPLAVFDNSGQDCCARSRILVQRDILDEFLEKFVAATKQLRIGDPSSESTELGPLVSAEHRASVLSFVDEELNVVYRGESPNSRGHWLAPIIAVDEEATSKAANEEIFGPIAVVIPFDTEEEAIALANDSIYGLSGSIWTGDTGRALRVARAVESGTLSINSNSSVRVQAPFGGFKQSGLGRELGMEGLRGYTELKSVFVSTES